MKKFEIKKKLTLPAWLFVAAMALYCELLLHFWTAKNVLAGRVITVTLFALGLGFVLGLISSLFNAKVSKGVAVGIGVILILIISSLVGSFSFAPHPEKTSSMHARSKILIFFIL